MTTIHKAIRIATEDAAKVENYKPFNTIGFLSPYVFPGIPKPDAIPTVKDCGLKGFHYKTVKSKV
jgi:hypothetical protein